MLVYRVCSKREIMAIINDKGFTNVGNYYDVNLKRNTFKYDSGVRYLHFYDKYDDVLHSNTDKGRYICEYDIPDDILTKYSSVGFYLDYINFRSLVDVREYAIPTYELVFKYLLGYDVLEQELDYEDIIDCENKCFVRKKIIN